MAESQTVLLVGPGESTFAELLIEDEEEGWLTGRIISRNFPPEVQKALAWYDEVVQDQMLSYLDEATAAVERFGLRARFADGSLIKVYSLHITPSAEVSFRITPVSPPELPQARSSFHG